MSSLTDWWRRLRHRTPAPAPSPTASSVRALRIADLLERFGVNTFSSTTADANTWGSWPADYSPESVIAALRWFTGSSGLTLQVREYHFADRVWQADWCARVNAATGARFTVALGAGAGDADVASLTTLATNGTGWLDRVEGLNEPNTDFGNGVVLSATTVSLQKSLSANVTGLKVSLAGPSVVFGLPFPEGYVTDYFTAAELILVNARSDLANGHFYPPTAADLDDGSGRGGALADVVTGLKKVYDGKPLFLTEWHPTLYNQRDRNLDPAYDAYYAPCFFLSALRRDVKAWFWYALFDFGTVFASGLFPKTGGVDPRPVAQTLRAMFALTGDAGATKRTFTPDALDLTVTGLPAPLPDSPDTGGHTMLFQNSLGVFFLFVWNAQEAPGGAAVPVTVAFPNRWVGVSDFKISDPVNPQKPLQAWAGVNKVTVSLDASVHLLIIRV